MQKSRFLRAVTMKISTLFNTKLRESQVKFDEQNSLHEEILCVLRKQIVSLALKNGFKKRKVLSIEDQRALSIVTDSLGSEKFTVQ
jgi:hypothetical protein